VDLAERWQEWPNDNDPHAPAGFTAFVVSDTAPLHHLVREIWRLARALPIEPLRVFEAQTRILPRTTEAERLVIQRVGQDVFREALMTYWGGQCAVTGVVEPRLLRASHIKSWGKCETDAERLDVYNGLLLAAHLDAAFDAGLISFSDEGQIIFSSRFRKDARRYAGLAHPYCTFGIAFLRGCYHQIPRSGPRLAGPFGANCRRFRASRHRTGRRYLHSRGTHGGYRRF
jgi:putative restriction endonuclease